jgi:hypothetical protein
VVVTLRVARGLPLLCAAKGNGPISVDYTSVWNYEQVVFLPVPLTSLDLFSHPWNSLTSCGDLSQLVARPGHWCYHDGVTGSSELHERTRWLTCGSALSVMPTVAWLG